MQIYGMTNFRTKIPTPDPIRGYDFIFKNKNVLQNNFSSLSEAKGVFYPICQFFPSNRGETHRSEIVIIRPNYDVKYMGVIVPENELQDVIQTIKRKYNVVSMDNRYSFGYPDIHIKNMKYRITKHTIWCKIKEKINFQKTQRKRRKKRHLLYRKHLVKYMIKDLVNIVMDYVH